MQRTFVMVKPDGVQRGLVGEIIGRFERRGLRLVGLKMLVPTRDIAETHYAVHLGKPFYADLVAFITSGPVVAMAWEGTDAVDLVRQMMGALRPLEAMPGTIRGDLTTEVQTNVVHGSDSGASAVSELGLWFSSKELMA